MLCRKLNALGAEIPELSLLCSRGQFAGEPDHLAEYSNVPQLRRVYRIIPVRDRRIVAGLILIITIFTQSSCFEKQVHHRGTEDTEREFSFFLYREIPIEGKNLSMIRFLIQSP
jgi:hypothetical protein